MTTNMEIYTIGHSNHTVENLLALLREHAIEVVVDVRSQPYSRYVPHFNREPLAQALRERGFAYEHRGDRLGGRPTDESFLLADGSVDYDGVRASADFQQALDELLVLAQERRVAPACSGSPWARVRRWQNRKEEKRRQDNGWKHALMIYGLGRDERSWAA